MSASKLSLEGHRCLYEVLDVPRSATESDIAKAYKKQALIHHPDRNLGDEEAATERFKSIQAAFEILSDKDERAFYDAHRTQILRGVDPAAPPTDEFDVVPLLTPWAFSSFDDSLNQRDDGSIDDPPTFRDPRNFYAVYSAAFDQIRELEGRSKKRTPKFGSSQSSSSSVRRFYHFWADEFHSTRPFGYAAKFNLAEAENRWMRREMGKRNSKAKQQERRRWEETVIRLATFVRKRDPRWRLCLIEAEKKEQQAQQRRRREQSKQRRRVDDQKAAEIRRRLEEQEEKEEGRDHTADESGSDNDELLATDRSGRSSSGISNSGIVDSVPAEQQAVPFTDHPYECLVCDKVFKSAATLATHERGQKHMRALEKLREQLELEEALLLSAELDAAENGGGHGAAVASASASAVGDVGGGGSSGIGNAAESGGGSTLDDGLDGLSGTGDIADGGMDIATVEALKEWLESRRKRCDEAVNVTTVGSSAESASVVGRDSISPAQLSPDEEQIHLDELLAMQMQEMEDDGNGDEGSIDDIAGSIGGDTLESAATTTSASEGNSQVELDLIFAKHLASGVLRSEEETSTLTAAEKLEMLEEHELLTAIEVSQLAADILALQQAQQVKEDEQGDGADDEDEVVPSEVPSALIDLELQMKKNQRAKSKRQKRKKRKGRQAFDEGSLEERVRDEEDQVKVAAMIDVALDERSLDKLLTSGVCEIGDLLNPHTGELDPLKLKRYQRKLARMKKRDQRKLNDPRLSGSLSGTAAVKEQPDEEAAIVEELESELRRKKESEEMSALHDSQRIQQFLDRFIVGGGAGSISTDSPTTPDTHPVSPDKVKPKRRKQRKKDQCKAQHKQDQRQRVFACGACGERFQSNSKLHKHLRELPKHALLVNRGRFMKTQSESEAAVPETVDP